MIESGEKKNAPKDDVPEQLSHSGNPVTNCKVMSELSCSNWWQFSNANIIHELKCIVCIKHSPIPV